MPWFLMDDGFPTHPGALATSLAARGLWATAGAWCSGRSTDVVPSHVLASFGSTPELVDELCQARMLKRVRDGYQVQQQGLCKIPTREAVESGRKSKAARQARWRERRRHGDAPVDAPQRLPVDAVDNRNENINAGQNTRGRRPVDASTRASPGPDPSPNGGSVVNRSNGSNGRASPDLTDLIISELQNATGRTVDRDWAAKTLAYILEGRNVTDPAAYVRQVIRSEPDPQQRFLPLY